MCVDVLAPVFDVSYGDSDLEDSAFDTSRTDIEDWKGSTLTGANVPYHPADPRHKPVTQELSNIPIDGMWNIYFCTTSLLQQEYMDEWVQVVGGTYCKTQNIRPT